MLVIISLETFFGFCTLVYEQLMLNVQLTVGAVGARPLVITIEEDGRDLDNAVGVIVTSLCNLFPSVPTEYVTCSF